MTATERMCALLDERGVEYETYHDAALTEVDAVFWQDRNGQPCSAICNADDIPRRMLSVQCVISPEQAVDATLGRGTCRMELTDLRGPAYTDVYVCSECGGEVMVGTVMGVSDVPKWCPWCGRKVDA